MKSNRKQSAKTKTTKHKKKEDVYATNEIDFYQQLKQNLKDSNFFCTCLELPNLYCLTCKSTVCKTCNRLGHEGHNIVKKDYTELNPNDVNYLLTDFEKELNNQKIIDEIKTNKDEIIKLIETFTDDLVKKVEDMKKQKIEELNKLFENYEQYLKNAHNQVSEIKNKLRDYYINNKDFYQYRTKNNEDEYNVIFLIHYDIINIIKNQTTALQTINDCIKEDIKNIKIIETHKYKDISNKNDKILNMSNKDYYESLSKDIKMEVNIPLCVRQRCTTNNEIYVPFDHFKKSINRLNDQYFSGIFERAQKYTDSIEWYKNKVFQSFQTFKSLKEIQTEIDYFEHSEARGPEGLFTKRKFKINHDKEPLTALPTKSKILNTGTSVVLSNKKIKILSKDDICLNDIVLQKYYGYIILEVYAEYFKIVSSENPDDLFSDLNEELKDRDYAKVNEGTNTLVIYEKKNKKVSKVKLPLAKNPYGYINFPVGCRCVLIGDEVYITGGRDESKEYANVLVYNKKTNKLKRICDLNFPRYYHTMIFSDVFNTVLVFGGQGEHNCEVFDPLYKRWLLLPSLNYARANTYVYLDKPRGLMYTIFGKERKVQNDMYSPIIEYLDLAQMKNGWAKLDYKNRSEISFEDYINLLPLNNEMILGYGGCIRRANNRDTCIIHLIKKEITKVGKELSDQLKLQAMKNEKLSGIVSYFNVK